jgi:catechol 2,3-dioxygenase-like lactoylglutathione lyase family enzyme
MTLELHHTAYRVEAIERSLKEWCGRFGATVELPPTLVAADQVVVAFLALGGGRIELIEQVGTRPTRSELGRPDHICLICRDFDDRVARACEDNGLIVRPPVATEAFGMRRMCFIFYEGIGLVELVERW